MLSNRGVSYVHMLYPNVLCCSPYLIFSCVGKCENWLVLDQRPSQPMQTEVSPSTKEEARELISKGYMPLLQSNKAQKM